MKQVFLIFLLLYSSLSVAEYGFPFHDGELDAGHVGELTGLAGEVIEIKPTKEKFPLYKLNLRIEGIGPIWVTSIAPSPGREIAVGDMIVFKGYISSASEMDSSGDLAKQIGGDTLLLAISAERPK